MKCGICGIQIDSVEKAISTGWIPYVWDGDREQDGPFCPSCCESLIEIDDDGECAVKEEYQERSPIRKVTSLRRPLRTTL
jgi:hypothetical protein